MQFDLLVLRCKVILRDILQGAQMHHMRQETCCTHACTLTLNRGQSGSHPGHFTVIEIAPIPTAQNVCWDPVPILTWWQRDNCLQPMWIKCWSLKTICTTECKGVPVHTIPAGRVQVLLHIPAILTQWKETLLHTEVRSWVALKANATFLKRSYTSARNCITFPWLSSPQPSHHNDNYPSSNT